jgi:hypothetical protein
MSGCSSRVAGYFRAMITTLDPFDKVAGGLAWCITAANENVNLGLLFEEHGRQGEKVYASSALVSRFFFSFFLSFFLFFFFFLVDAFYFGFEFLLVLLLFCFCSCAGLLFCTWD